MRTAPFIGLVALLLIAGCTEPQPTETPRKSVADLERENRARGDAITKLRGELAAVRTERDGLQQALDSARKTGTAPQQFQFEAAKVELGWLTAAVNLDDNKVTGRRGDNGIAAYVSLYDQFDTSIKTAGSFQLDLFDLERSKDFILQTWSFEPEAAAKYWQRFPACYQFKLPLSSDVYAKKAVLKVTFRRPGKKDLTATKGLTIER
jgi:hypothetical protein